MTRYEQGFLTKCAEYGLDANASMQLMKRAMKLPKLGALKKLWGKYVMGHGADRAINLSRRAAERGNSRLAGRMADIAAHHGAITGVIGGGTIVASPLMMLRSAFGKYKNDLDEAGVNPALQPGMVRNLG